MNLPRPARSFLAGALLRASALLRDLGEGLELAEAPEPPRVPPAPPPGGSYQVTLSPAAQAMIAQRKARVASDTDEVLPLVGSLEARRRAGAR